MPDAAELRPGLAAVIGATGLWVVVHGLGAGAIFLLAFAGGLAELRGLRPGMLTSQGAARALTRLRRGTALMAAMAWLACLSGTWMVYPAYRVPPPEGAADLSAYPKYYLLADEALRGWHAYGMEWKEHVGWVAPILTTAVSFVVWRHGELIAKQRGLRVAVTTLYLVAFAAAAAAGVLGAFVTKLAPVR